MCLILVYPPQRWAETPCVTQQLHTMWLLCPLELGCSTAATQGRGRGRRAVSSSCLLNVQAYLRLSESWESFFLQQKQMYRDTGCCLSLYEIITSFQCQQMSLKGTHEAPLAFLMTTTSVHIMPRMQRTQMNCFKWNPKCTVL